MASMSVHNALNPGWCQKAAQPCSSRAAEQLIRRAAACESTVLLTGETGTGKEVAARTIHRLSRRGSGPFVPVDCPSLTESLAESQLFGHVRGAFTGATRDALGFFRAAEGGTLFLDEVADLPSPLQAKLLRSLQERRVVPVGSSRALAVDVRIIAATHRDLPDMVLRGQFREDLFFRLNVVRIRLPALRHRTDEIASLAGLLIARAAELNGLPVRDLTRETIEVLSRYRWPGNIRELANALEHAFVMAQGPRITPADLPESVRRSVHETRHVSDSVPIPTLAEAERCLVVQAMKQACGRKSKAATMLGVSRQGLYRLLRRHGLWISATPGSTRLLDPPG